MEILGLVDIPLYLILALGSVALLYLYSTWNHDFFRNQGIPGPRPYPFFGNSIEVVYEGRNAEIALKTGPNGTIINQWQGFSHSFHKWKQMYGKIYGYFLGPEPVFVVSDLEILKEVLVKSFNNFRNRRKPLLLSNPFGLGVVFLEDAAWKRVRNIITPTFSGARLRAMCPSINDCAQTLTSNFSKTFNKKASVNMKEYFGAYTMDVISRTAFGVNVDSQNDFSNPFVSNAKLVFSPNESRQWIMLLSTAFPFMRRVLGAFQLNFFSNDVNTFFINNITEMIKQREKDQESKKKTDFLQLLMDAEIPDTTNDLSQTSNGHMANGHLPKQQSLRRLTTDEIIGQGIIFFVAGYETTASTLNFASYALATNPDVQEKAYKEIKDVLGDEEPNYDNIGELKYLENVIIETLRLYPPAVALNRRASETITIKGVTIPKGFTVFIPVQSIQRDPELFKEPEKFKPERHEEKINPLSFLTFGFGPRICIGMRLALVEAKIALIHVMRKVRFETAADTPTKLTFKSAILLQSKEANMLKLVPRD